VRRILAVIGASCGARAPLCLGDVVLGPLFFRRPVRAPQPARQQGRREAHRVVDGTTTTFGAALADAWIVTRCSSRCRATSGTPR